MNSNGALDDLADRLVTSAERDGPGVRAAVAVLVVHRSWLRHPGFLLACVRTFRDQVWIDWRIVRRFLSRTPCPAMDGELLLLAAELAQSGSGRRLRDSRVLRDLDAATRAALADAAGPDHTDRSPTRRG